MKRIPLLLLIVLMIMAIPSKADEGMWIPMLLKDKKMDDLQKAGCRLSAEEIYSINHASLKDAIMLFGGGCTAELISEQGLIITNHHCGYSYIQKHSSLEHDYLTEGFWAMSREEELNNPGLTVSFLVEMRDVTNKVLEGIDTKMNETDRSSKISKNIDALKETAGEGNDYEISIQSFYHGNQYFMFINEVYKDVRLVGAPPSSIGKFGGDTDNWMWPRHTGDFSLFRIYTAPDGSPAEYAPDNIPLKPKKSFKISLQGIDKGDFTMVFGYPGSTDEYAPSYAIDMIRHEQNPYRIQFREQLINIIKDHMVNDKKTRLQYASKVAGMANGWKKWIGENNGLDRMRAIERKKGFESEFKGWVHANDLRKEKYAGILPEYEKLYTEFTPYNKVYYAILEQLYNNEIFNLVSAFGDLTRLTKDNSEEAVKESIAQAQKKADQFFKDYNMEVATETCLAGLGFYMEQIPESYWPESLKEIQEEGIEEAITEAIHDSFMGNPDLCRDFLDNYKIKDKKDIKENPIYRLYSDFRRLYQFQIRPHHSDIQNSLDSLDRIYMAAQMDFQKDKVFYPDANLTLRLTYGKVQGYYPTDAVHYKYYTTVNGIMEKDNPDIYDYDVPDKLKSLYEKRDFGKYAGDDGKMHVCFIATNHTSGGNSGSPVINADGHLIGVNFDRNWEGTMSDLMYDSDMCRNITLDIRYALFIIDKFAGADHLIAEMDIIQ